MVRLLLFAAIVTPESVLVEQQRKRLSKRMFGVESEPQRIGRYAIIGDIGHGGMGLVYVADDHRLCRKVAIKTMLDPMDPAGRRRFQREAQLMAQLNHANIVRIYDIDENDDVPFIVMEFIEGVTLRKWLQQATRSGGEIMAVFLGAARGLAAAHEVGVVHRDFKPDNVMVDTRGHAWLTDFGLAHGELPSAPEPEPLGSPCSFGTPMYMAPEQWRGDIVTAQADQFSFCTALWEALYGQHPFMDERSASAWSIRAAPESTEWCDVARVLLRGLAFDPCCRFESMSELTDALGRA